MKGAIIGIIILLSFFIPHPALLHATTSQSAAASYWQVGDSWTMVQQILNSSALHYDCKIEYYPMYITNKVINKTKVGGVPVYAVFQQYIDPYQTNNQTQYHTDPQFALYGAGGFQIDNGVVTNGTITDTQFATMLQHGPDKFTHNDTATIQIYSYHLADPKQNSSQFTHLSRTSYFDITEENISVGQYRFDAYCVHQIALSLTGNSTIFVDGVKTQYSLSTTTYFTNGTGQISNGTTYDYTTNTTTYSISRIYYNDSMNMGDIWLSKQYGIQLKFSFPQVYWENSTETTTTNGNTTTWISHSDIRKMLGGFEYHSDFNNSYYNSHTSLQSSADGFTGLNTTGSFGYFCSVTSATSNPGTTTSTSVSTNSSAPTVTVTQSPVTVTASPSTVTTAPYPIPTILIFVSIIAIYKLKSIDQ